MTGDKRPKNNQKKLVEECNRWIKKCESAARILQGLGNKHDANRIGLSYNNTQRMVSDYNGWINDGAHDDVMSCLFCLSGHVSGRRDLASGDWVSESMSILVLFDDPEVWIHSDGFSAHIRASSWGDRAMLPIDMDVLKVLFSVDEILTR